MKVQEMDCSIIEFEAEKIICKRAEIKTWQDDF
jgi:hypothetical protein